MPDERHAVLANLCFKYISSLKDPRPSQRALCVSGTLRGRDGEHSDKLHESATTELRRLSPQLDFPRFDRYLADYVLAEKSNPYDIHLAFESEAVPAAKGAIEGVVNDFRKLLLQPSPAKVFIGAANFAKKGEKASVLLARIEEESHNTQNSTLTKPLVNTCLVVLIVCYAGDKESVLQVDRTCDEQGKQSALREVIWMGDKKTWLDVLPENYSDDKALESDIRKALRQVVNEGVVIESKYGNWETIYKLNPHQPDVIT